MSPRDRLEALARRWRVTLGEPFETNSSVIAYGQRRAEAVVLKVVKKRGDEWRSSEVARAFAGRGMVRVLELDEGAALFERIEPGIALVEVARRGGDAEATAIVAEVIGTMVPDAAPAWCPTVLDLSRAFSWYAGSGDTQIPAEMVSRAGAMYTALCETQGPTRLLHGDLQHYNILEDRERGWLAIDPKGVVGEVAYEVGASLRNPGELPEVFADPAVVAQRIAMFTSRLGLDADRVLRWGYAQAVLSAIWHVEDGGDVGPDNGSLMLARVLDAMIR